MAYTKTSWSDGVTPVDASNMNKIEDALADQDERIDGLANAINISSYISMDPTYGFSVVYAYYKAGIVFIQITGQLTTTDTRVIIGAISSPYCPAFSAYGYFNSLTSNDRDLHFLNQRIMSSGDFQLATATAMTAAGFFTYCYPL